MPIPLVGLQKVTLNNYPGRVAACVFLPGCDMRCPYCHNAALARAPSDGSGLGEAEGLVSLDDALAYIERRKGLLGGVAISGGEPLVSPLLREVIVSVKALGLPVKVDTNGQSPGRLSGLLGSPLRPDMVSLDVKTTVDRYRLLGGDGDLMLQSLQVLRSAEVEGLEVEYRTTLAPGIVDEDVIRGIARMLGPGARWSFSEFRPGECLDPSFNGKAAEMAEAEARAIAEDEWNRVSEEMQ